MKNIYLNRFKSSPLTLLLTGALFISFSPPLVKIIGLKNMGPSAIGFWRTFLGSVILFIWVKVSGGKIKISILEMKWAFFTGFIFAVDLYVWHRAIIYAGVGIATILGNTQVLITALLSFFIFKERINEKFFIAAIFSLFGIFLLLGIGSDIVFTDRYLVGIMFGILTGIVYALFLITLKASGKIIEGIDFRVYLAWFSFYTSIFLIIISLLEKEKYIPPDVSTFLLLLALAFIAQSIGWWAITVSIPKLKSAISSIGLLLQPVMSTLWGILFFNELFTRLQIVGAVVTIAGIYIGTNLKDKYVE